MIKSILSFLVCFLLLQSPFAATLLPQALPVPGGIAVVPVASKQKPDVYFNEKRILVLNQDGEWWAIVGIPLDTLPGIHTLNIHQNDKITTGKFEVQSKEYKTQHISLKNKRQVNPTSVDLQRIENESVIITASKENWRDQDKINMNLILPAQGRFSSPFGLRRFFNNQSRKPHSGLDIAAPEGTGINASGDGIVINTGNYFFNGNTVFIDHGQGFITMYCHLSKILVKPDQTVHQGEIIGTVGKTGRATGPHLHWSVYLNGTAIDPKQFIQ